MVCRIAAVVLMLFLMAETKPSRFNTCGFPNSTDVNPHTYSCNSNAAMQVLKTVILDQSTKKPVYPISPQKPIIIDLTAVNHGIQYNDNKANVKVYEYSSDWLTGECKWNEIPTFGLLDNIDGCQMAHNCPLKPGNLDLQLPLDLSKYAAIINLLASNTPYQLHIEMFDYNEGSSHEQIACVVAQVHFI